MPNAKDFVRLTQHINELTWISYIWLFACICDKQTSNRETKIETHARKLTQKATNVYRFERWITVSPISWISICINTNNFLDMILCLCKCYSIPFWFVTLWFSLADLCLCVVFLLLCFPLWLDIHHSQRLFPIDRNCAVGHIALAENILFLVGRWCRVFLVMIFFFFVIRFSL